MRKRRSIPILLSLAALIWSASAISPVAHAFPEESEPALTTAGARPKALEGVSFDQNLGASVPKDLTFTDAQGKLVRFGDLLGEKPVLLVLAYFRCPNLCTLVLNGMTEAVRKIPFDVGKEYRIITVSIDPKEGHRLALGKKRTYLARYDRTQMKDDFRGWRFLTGREPEIRRLAKSIGFNYRYDDASGQYSHPSGFVVLTPEGRISRYFFGVDFNPRDLRLALAAASSDRIGSPIDQLFLFCFHYDPASGRYGATIMNWIRILGALTAIGLALMILLLARKGPVRSREDGGR